MKQRVTLRCQVAPFELSETASYIATRIRTAGGDAARMFTREAVMLIHERSNGIARIVSVICDNALVTGFALGQERINAEIILEVVRDFDLVSQGGLEGSPAPESRPEPSRSIHGPRDESGGAELDSVAVAAAGDPNDAEAAAEPRELFAGPGRNRRLSFLRRS